MWLATRIVLNVCGTAWVPLGGYGVLQILYIAPGTVLKRGPFSEGRTVGVCPGTPSLRIQMCLHLEVAILSYNVVACLSFEE